MELLSDRFSRAVLELLDMLYEALHFTFSRAEMAEL
jgi:hypothetical protein